MPRLNKEMVAARETFVLNFFSQNIGKFGSPVNAVAAVNEALKADKATGGMAMNPTRVTELYEMACRLDKPEATVTQLPAPAPKPEPVEAKPDDVSVSKLQNENRVLRMAVMAMRKAKTVNKYTVFDVNGDVSQDELDAVVKEVIGEELR